MLTGVIVGYDPGGDKSHGVAELRVQGGQPEALITRTFQSTEDVIGHLENLSSVVAIGVDTLTCWSTGPGAWRPADRWLRNRYVAVRNSIIAPNALYGSMALNGMAVLLSARLTFPNVLISETHPKVLCWHLLQQKYDYATKKDAMDQSLALSIGLDISPVTEHEWDAALSTLAAFKGACDQWTFDLHSLPTVAGERIVWPCGRTSYFWPVSDR